MYLDIAKRIVSSVVFAVVLFSFEWFVSSSSSSLSSCFRLSGLFRDTNSLSFGFFFSFTIKWNEFS